MYNKLLFFIVLCCWIGAPSSDKANLFINADSVQYYKFMNVSASDTMPDLSFELTGTKRKENTYGYFYYPKKLLIKIKEDVLQEFNFSEDDFAPCTLDDIGFEYGDFKFNGYGGFRILSTSMGQNPSYYYWIWDQNEYRFVEYEDLGEIIGYTTFDYDNEVIHVVGMGGADYHEFMTYSYIDDKLTLIEKAIDSGGDRKIYKLIDNELRLTEITESNLK